MNECQKTQRVQELHCDRKPNTPKPPNDLVVPKLIPCGQRKEDEQARQAHQFYVFLVSSSHFTSLLQRVHWCHVAKQGLRGVVRKCIWLRDVGTQRLAEKESLCVDCESLEKEMNRAFALGDMSQLSSTSTAQKDRFITRHKQTIS
jgi:hypothetical protein